MGKPKNGKNIKKLEKNGKNFKIKKHCNKYRKIYERIWGKSIDDKKIGKKRKYKKIEKTKTK